MFAGSRASSSSQRASTRQSAGATGSGNELEQPPQWQGLETVEKDRARPAAKTDTGADSKEESMSGRSETTTFAARIACIECARRWIVPSERWRLKITDDEPRQTVPYCPDCARREFEE